MEKICRMHAHFSLFTVQQELIRVIWYLMFCGFDCEEGKGKVKKMEIYKKWFWWFLFSSLLTFVVVAVVFVFVFVALLLLLFLLLLLVIVYWCVCFSFIFLCVSTNSNRPFIFNSFTKCPVFSAQLSSAPFSPTQLSLFQFGSAVGIYHMTKQQEKIQLCCSIVGWDPDKMSRLRFSVLLLLLLCFF